MRITRLHSHVTRSAAVLLAVFSAVACGQNAPAGVKGLAVMSPGEDGKEGTADDIKSW